MTNRSTDEGEAVNSLSLLHAMKAADVTRKHYHGEATTASSAGIPPGFLQGIAAFVATGILLLPVRRRILRYAGNQPGGRSFQHFVDLSISVVGAMGASQVGLVVGSLYGTKVYLDMVKQEPPTSNSPLTDNFCEMIWSDVLPPHLHDAGPPSNL